MNPGLLLTFFLVTLSEADRMAGLRKLESPSLVPNQHRTSLMGVGGRARRSCRASDLQRAAWGWIWDLGLLLTVYLVTVSEPDRMAG